MKNAAGDLRARKQRKRQKKTNEQCNRGPGTKKENQENRKRAAVEESQLATWRPISKGKEKKKEAKLKKLVVAWGRETKEKEKSAKKKKLDRTCGPQNK